ncbi:MAG: UDP-2,3-diacylglucosamine diphosphatase [Candidatus Methylacidiphilales bacterium]
MSKRKIKLAVISDIHLGTYGCQAKAVNKYLKSIDPEILVLNGDIIDIWQFSKHYWPQSHMKVVQRIFKMLSNGTKIYYLTGNHDEMLRRFTDFNLGNLQVLNKLVLELDGKKAWFFHGDVFDISMKHSKWLAKLGGVGYDLLIVLNSMVNFISEKILGRGRLSFSKKVKQGVKSAIKFIDDFEETTIQLAIEKKYDYVVCGHIHQPSIKTVTTNLGTVTYLNSGDWVENLTALEYHAGMWQLHHYVAEPETEQDKIEQQMEELESNSLLNVSELFNNIVSK